jgi:hypothetical protein
VTTRAMFAGNDASGHPRHWTPDGTAAGTIELTASHAYAYGLTPQDITTLSPPSVLATRVVCG